MGATRSGLTARRDPRGPARPWTNGTAGEIPPQAVRGRPEIQRLAFQRLTQDQPMLGLGRAAMPRRPQLQLLHQLLIEAPDGQRSRHDEARGRIAIKAGELPQRSG